MADYKLLTNPVDNYPAIQRHYQFSDIHNGSWYIEILGSGTLNQFIVQEVRNGTVKKRSQPMSFAEARKLLWDRSFKMSLEAGHESLPPPQVTIK